MPHRLILVTGYAASGKTRVGKDVARRLPATYLDKDTLSSSFVERLLAALGQPPGDRDGDVYREDIRPFEYEGLVAAGLEAAELGADVILSAPFLAQLADAAWTANLLKEARQRGLTASAVWVTTDLKTLRHRMVGRSSPRDDLKLAGWEVYSAGMNPDLDRQFSVPTHRFDNSEGADYDGQIKELLKWLNRVT